MDTPDRRYAKFPTFSSLLSFLSFPLAHLSPLCLFPNGVTLRAAFLSLSLTLSVSIVLQLAPSAPHHPLIFSPTPQRPPSCSCIFCCLLQPRTTRRGSIPSRLWRPRASVATRSCHGQLSVAAAKVLSAACRGMGGVGWGGCAGGGSGNPGVGCSRERKSERMRECEEGEHGSK